MVDELVTLGRTPDAGTAWQRLAAADRVTSAGMWLVAHMTYSQRVRTDGATLGIDDFKTTPEGHTGGSLHMVPAYAGYRSAERPVGKEGVSTCRSRGSA